MIVLIGTVPYKTGVYIGDARIENDHLYVGNAGFPVERGTAAMAAACALTCRFYGLPAPVCILGGDTADGRGTDLMFKEVNSNLDAYRPDVVTLHYLFPKIAYGILFISKIASLPFKPQLIADAGGMYLMKTIKKADFFDVFTPDEGELLFLADEYAAHPLYVRREILAQVTDRDLLASEAFQNKNAPRTLVVKGAFDGIYRDGVKIKECRSPNIPAMEAVGGTGDTITGMLTAMRYRKDEESEYTACIVNRLIGKRINCTPATQIKEFIRNIPAVLEEYEKTSY